MVLGIKRQRAGNLPGESKKFQSAHRMFCFEKIVNGEMNRFVA